MKTLILALLLLLAPFQQYSDVKVQYDKLDGSTGVVMFRVPLGRGEIGWLPAPMGVGDPDPLDMTLIATFKGKTPPPRNPDDAVYFLISGQRDLGLLSAPSLVLLVDGERITMGTEWQIDPISRSKESKQVRIPLTYAMLSKIANSKASEGKLGSTKFHFPSRLKVDIRAFIKSSCNVGLN